MNFMKSMSHWFANRNAAERPVTTAADILSYVASLIDDTALVEKEVSALPRLRELPAYNQREIVPGLYERFEAVLCPKQYEVEALRKKIRDNFTTEDLRRSNIDVLLPEEEQAIRRLEHEASQVARTVYVRAGRNKLQALIERSTKNTVFDGVVVDVDGSLDFSAAERHFYLLPSQPLPVAEELLSQLITELANLSAIADASAPAVDVIPVTPEARSTFVSLGLQEFIEQGFMRDISFTVVNATGEEIPTVLTGTALKNNQGVIQGMIIVAKDMRKLQAYARARLNEITPILQKVSRGDFSQTIEIPEKVDEFTEHKVALRFMVENFKDMVESIRQQAQRLEAAKVELEERVAERTAELARTQEKFKVLYESSADAVMILEPPTWKFTSGNPATLKLFGVTDESEFIALSPLDMAPEKQADGQSSKDKMMAMLTEAMKEGRSFFQWTSRKRTGEEFPTTVLISRVTEGDKTYAQAVVRDLSEIEKAKQSLEEQVAARTEELQELNKNLEGEVAKRTKELESKLFELERFNKVAVDRELKMIELKEEIARLRGEHPSSAVQTTEDGAEVDTEHA